MTTDGLTDEGLAALDATLARHTATGAVPGLVALVARGGRVHVTSAGLTGILLTQRMMTSPEPPAVVRDFWSATYAAFA